jgi:hypothetical protein
MSNWGLIYDQYKDLRYGDTEKHHYKGTGIQSGVGYARQAWSAAGGNPNEFDTYNAKYANTSGTYQDYWNSVSFDNVLSQEREAAAKEAKATQIRKNDQAQSESQYRQLKASEGDSATMTSGNDRSQSGQGATLMSGKEGVMLADTNKKRRTLLGV